jgi:hypothetical protein
MAVGAPAHRAPTMMASYIVSLRVGQTLPNAKDADIGRITQNRASPENG